MKLSSLIRFGVMGAFAAAAFVACSKDEKTYTLSSEKEVLSIKLDTISPSYNESSKTYTFDVDTIIKNADGGRIYNPSSLNVYVKLSPQATCNPSTIAVSFWDGAPVYKMKDSVKYLVVAQDGSRDSFFVKVNPVHIAE